MDDMQIIAALTRYLQEDLASVGLDSLELTPDYPLLANGIVDSLGLFKLIAFAEDSFHIKIAPAEIVPENFGNINAIKDLVQSKQPVAGSR